MARVTGNWLGVTGNPYNLLPPPAGFLRELAVFDPDAVIVPSRRQFGYWLTRRRRLTAGITTVLDLDGDSKTFAAYDLIPVCLWGGSITWGPHVLQWLKDRDLWSHGGAEGASKALNAQDEAEDAGYLRWRAGENSARARSMYRTYKRRTGESVALNDVGRGRGQVRSRRDTTPRPTTAKVSQTPAPAGWSATGSGIITPPSLR